MLSLVAESTLVEVNKDRVRVWGKSTNCFQLILSGFFGAVIHVLSVFCTQTTKLNCKHTYKGTKFNFQNLGKDVFAM